MRRLKRVAIVLVMKCSRYVLPILALGLGLGLVVHSAPAHAQERTPGYAEQTLLADGASVALVVTGALVSGSNNDAGAALSVVGVGGFGLASPIIHAAHGRWDRAGISLAMRVLGVPLAGATGALVGAAAWHDSLPGDERGYSSLRGLVVGGLVGFGVGAITIAAVDAAVLARGTRRVGTTAPANASLQILPSIDPARRSASFGVVGTF